MAREPTCANCGTALVGAWCHACGQRARALHAPLRALLSEAADVLFDVDNRFFRSARTLMRRPGALSVAWAEGRRASFTGPVRLYLLSSVLYFLVASQVEPVALGFITFDSGPEMNRRFAEALPRMMFAIVPLAAAVFALAFRAGGRPYIEHLVFALHLHAGWYVLFTLEAALAPLAPNGFVAGDPLAIGASVLQLALRLGTLAYLFLATRRFYGHGWGSITARTAGALMGYGALLAVAVAAYVGAAMMWER
jgi:hypothetical protein